MKPGDSISNGEVKAIDTIKLVYTCIIFILIGSMQVYVCV